MQTKRPTIEEMRQFLEEVTAFANPRYKRCIAELMLLLDQHEESEKLEAGITIHEGTDRTLHYDLGKLESDFRVGKNWDTQSYFIGVGPNGLKYSLTDFTRFLAAGKMALRAAQRLTEGSDQ